jgi:hypothetical protein
MKGGKVPIHLQRWAPQDYHLDEHVRLLKARRDYRTLTFYRHFLDHSFTSGGDLPADPEALAAIVEMPTKDVKTSLAFCLGRLLTQDGDRLHQKRVLREVAEELEYRELQADRGRLGGRPKTKAVAKPVVSEPESERLARRAPAPAPAPAPCAVRRAPTPTPIASQPDSADAAVPPEDLADLPADERVEKGIEVSKKRLERKVRELAAQVHERLPARDLADVLRDMTAYVDGNGVRHAGVVEISKLSYERLEKSAEDGEAWLKHLDAQKAVVNGA